MLVLASQSASRKAMLEAAGVEFTARPAAVDERAIEAEMGGAAAEEIALALARAKALAVARQDPEPWVLGSDSLVTVEGRRFDKPRGLHEAAEHLAFFSGKVMELTSAAALARGGHTYWDHAETARLQVRHLSEAFIESYLAEEWPAVSGCVGVFRIEARGVQLFEAIEGSHFTVLGMPLLPVLGALRSRGVLVA
jgi:septum formation protein